MTSPATDAPRLAFLVLAHDRLDLVVRLLRRLVGEGDAAFVHVDAKVPAAVFAAFRMEAARIGPGPVTVIENRVRCAWGDWSLVEATLRLIEAADEETGPATTHFHLISGADYPIRPLAMLRRFLAERPGQDFIECVPMDVARWNDTWLLHERYWYRHFFHVRQQRRLFRWSMRLQECLLPRRRFPEGLVPCLGSQWWCLRRETARKVAARLREPALARFFRTTWVPDELAIQSVAHAVSDGITNRLLTYYEFTDYGVPVVLHDGQERFVLGQPFFFARKISPHADGLRAVLDEVFEGRRGVDPPGDRYGKRLDNRVSAQRLFRDGLPGRRTLGWQRDPWWGELRDNARPYFVLAGTDAEALCDLADALNGQPGLLCHRDLFNPERIGFAGGADSFGPFGSDQTVLAAQFPNAFLYEVLSAAPPDRVSGFVFVAGQAEVALERFTGDRKAAIVLVTNGSASAPHRVHAPDPDPVFADEWPYGTPDQLAQAAFVADILRRTERSGVPVLRLHRRRDGVSSAGLAAITAALRRVLDARHGRIADDCASRAGLAGRTAESSPRNRPAGRQGADSAGEVGWVPGPLPVAPTPEPQRE